MPEALALVPRLVPPEVAAMLKIGIQSGNLRGVLPACRQTLNDALSQTRGAINYLAITVFVLLPAVPVVTGFFNVFILPKFEMLARESGADHFIHKDPGSELVRKLASKYVKDRPCLSRATVEELEKRVAEMTGKDAPFTPPPVCEEALKKVPPLLKIE